MSSELCSSFATRGVLPAVFALRAGASDIAIGATAALMAWKLSNRAHRTSFILWQALESTDPVLAAGLGTTARLLGRGQHTVPRSLIHHIICIAQASLCESASGDAQQTKTVPGFMAGGFESLPRT